MKRLLLALLGALMLLPVAAQSASELSAILGKKEANEVDFSYLIASSSGLECTPFEAYAWCDRFNTFPLTDTMNTPATPKRISHFLMANYQLKGGIMWSLTGDARYAYKELKYRGFWKQGTDPDTALSGRDLVRAVRQFFTDYPDVLPRRPDAPKPNPRYLEALLADKEATK
jgi:hypothetical protein